MLSEDIAGQITAGKELDAALSAGGHSPARSVEELITSKHPRFTRRDSSGPHVVEQWASETAEVLRGLPVGLAQFQELTSGARACRCEIFDAALLGRAYLTFGMEYLQEVLDHMSDYAEASGQFLAPSVTQNIYGGTFHGPIAAQILAIDSVIAGVVDNGAAGMSDALKAVKDAVVIQPGLDEHHRRDLLEHIDYLARSAAAPPTQRSHGIIKSVLAGLTSAATVGTELGEAMNAWGPILHRLVS